VSVNQLTGQLIGCLHQLEQFHTACDTRACQLQQQEPVKALVNAAHCLASVVDTVGWHLVKRCLVFMSHSCLT
jgi:hypothetical protein